jgi:hypothetical protein
MRATMTCAILSGVLAALPAVRAQDAPTAAQYRTSQNNLKQIGLAFHNYDSAYNTGWATDITDKDGKPLLSWRVKLLPFLEEDNLYRQFKLDEPWDSANNKKLIEKMPKVYAPVRGKAKAGETFYQTFSGEGAIFVNHKTKYKISTIPDGTSNTGLVFEAGEPVVWTKPADMPFDEKKALPKIGGMFDGVCQAVRGDGSVIRMKKDPDEAELKKFIMPADGNPIDLDKLTK